MGDVAVADHLRRQMVARLKDAGTLVSPAVEQAMAQVPRHAFVPLVDCRSAYLDQAVLVKHAADGSPVSSASQPTIVAIMLEQLSVQPGSRVLEVGTGTGYNAALLALLVGDGGHVVSVELEPDLANRAIKTLAQLGEHRVEVVVGDGRLGYSPRAPYDRVIVTAGARNVADSWTDQLASEGRLVVPIVDEHGLGSIVVVEKHDDQMSRRAGVCCGFLPIRDAAP